MPSEPPIASAKTVMALRPLLSGLRGWMLLLGAVFVSAALLEAGVLVLLVQLAMAIATDSEKVGFHLGPLGVRTVSLSQLFLLIAGLSGLRLGAEALSANLVPRLAADKQIELRRRATHTFLASTWDLKSTEREGHFQALTWTHASRVGNVVQDLALAIKYTLTLGIMLLAAFFVDIVAATALIASVALLFLALRPISRSSRRHAGDLAAVGLTYSNSINELVRLSPEIEVFRAQEAVEDRINRDIDAAGYAYRKQQFLGQILPATYQNLSIVLLVAGLAGLWVLDIGSLDSLGSIILLLYRALSYGSSLQSAYHRLSDAVPYYEEVARSLERYESSQQVDGGRPLPEIMDLAFHHVSFTYDHERAALNDVDFSIPRGECVGIIGPSGAGKSTLTQLLLRMRYPTSGFVTVNGDPASDFRSDDWFRLVAFVPQDAQLIEGTVAENIRFFRDSFSDEDVVRAATRAHIHEEIMAWEAGYDRVVGPRESALSGGQRQRICLARALLGQPQVLILDEPTSSLDLRSEQLVHETLKEMRGEVTLVIVAHRLSTLSICDRLMVLEGGELKAFEAPATLASSSSFYKDIVKLADLRE